MIGERYGALTVIERAGSNNGAVYLCECDCGRRVERRATSLRVKGRPGRSISCGCIVASATHRRTKTRLYRTWQNMRNRCHRPSVSGYRDYGARGISVCSEWFNSFESFAEWADANGYADNLTLDRIDCDGNYEPSNCRWATLTEQARNKRNNRVIEWGGLSLTPAEWSERLGVSYDAIQLRVTRGWSAERIMTQPFRAARRQK